MFSVQFLMLCHRWLEVVRDDLNGQRRHKLKKKNVCSYQSEQREHFCDTLFPEYIYPHECIEYVNVFFCFCFFKFFIKSVSTFVSITCSKKSGRKIMMKNVSQLVNEGLFNCFNMISSVIKLKHVKLTHSEEWCFKFMKPS